MNIKENKYRYFQPNKKDIKDNYGDCVIRALCKACNMEWLEVFDELMLYCRKEQCVPNEKVAYEQFLKNHGFKYYGISNKKGTTRPTVHSFTRENKSGKYVLIVANHLVSCVDGLYYDTWDSGAKSLYGFWMQ